MSFTRKVENFKCARCGAQVDGNGYTNHCPHCLWSKHVDDQPGDRASKCGGMMRPIAVSGHADKYIITFECEKCGVLKNNKLTADDNFEELLKIAKSE